MAKNIDDKLVLAISSRALFDLSESHKVYLSSGVEAYRQYQIDHEDEILEPGDAFLGATQGDEGDARIVQRGRVLLLEGERVVEVAQRLLEAAAVQQPSAGQGVGKGRKGIGLTRTLEEGQRLVEPLPRA